MIRAGAHRSGRCGGRPGAGRARFGHAIMSRSGRNLRLSGSSRSPKRLTEQGSVSAATEDHGRGTVAISDLVAHVADLAADALTVGEAERLRLAWLDADAAQETRRHDRIDGSGVDDQVDFDEPTRVGEVHHTHPHLGHPHATQLPWQPPSGGEERHDAIPSPGVFREQTKTLRRGRAPGGRVAAPPTGLASHALHVGAEAAGR